ncbi:MAG TPA: ester cyclase [Acidimicrobiales bacterium]
MTDSKETVARLVTEVINGRKLDLLDELCTPQFAPKLRRAFSEFLDAFPDWRQGIVELVAEDTTVVARFRCHGTHAGTWQGLPPTGRTMHVDEVYFFRFAGPRIRSAWGLEDNLDPHAPARRRRRRSETASARPVPRPNVTPPTERATTPRGPMSAAVSRTLCSWCVAGMPARVHLPAGGKVNPASVRPAGSQASTARAVAASAGRSTPRAARIWQPTPLPSSSSATSR